MIVSFLYLISIVFLMSSFLLLKKTNEKQNFIKWLIISFGLLFCYNSVIAFILSTFKIPIYLITISIVNLIVSVILFLFIKNKQNIQSYYVKKRDIFITLGFIVFVFVLGFLRFGFPFNIVYETCDPGTHFWTVKDFFENSLLLDKVVDQTIVNFETRQFGSYVNLGIIFKFLAPFMNDFDFYKVYILFDILMLLLSTLMFYFLVFNENKKSSIIILILGTILYTLGYPLNSMIIGFFYLGHSITLITMILMLFKLYDENKLNKILGMILLCISTLGLFFTYYLFVPVIFGGLFLYFIYKTKKNKNKIFTKYNILFISLVYVLPCLLGFLYFIVPNIGNNEQNAVFQLSLEGYCYSDIFSSALLFIPLIIYYFVYCIKNKKINFIMFVYCTLIVFIILIIILLFFKMASSYYLSKPFYLLWLLNFIILFKVVDIFCLDKKIEINCYLIFMVICAILSVTNLQKNVDSLTPYYSDKTYSNIFGIYNYNLTKYLNPRVILIHEEMDDLKEIYDMGVANVFSNAFPYARLWIASYFEKNKINYPENQLYDYISNNFYIGESKNPIDNINLYSNDIVYFYRLSIVSYAPYEKFKKGNTPYIETSSCVNCEIEHFDTFMLIRKK